VTTKSSLHCSFNFVSCIDFWLIFNLANYRLIFLIRSFFTYYNFLLTFDVRILKFFRPYLTCYVRVHAFWTYKIEAYCKVNAIFEKNNFEFIFYQHFFTSASIPCRTRVSLYIYICLSIFSFFLSFFLLLLLLMISPFSRYCETQSISIDKHGEVSIVKQPCAFTPPAVTWHQCIQILLKFPLNS
jgi:hypothetical protein